MWSALGSMFGRGPAIKEVNVHFEKRKLRVTLSPEDYDTKKRVPLSTFRAKLAGALHIPPRELALYQIEPQRKLSNMKAALEDYGVDDGGDLLAVHVKPEPAKTPESAPAKAPATPDERIDAVVASVESELGARIARLVNEGPPADAEQRETEHRVLSEIVLAKTIALDDVDVTTPEERQHRKNAIAQMQKYHKEIDAAIARPPRQANPAPAAPGAAPQPQPASEASAQATGEPDARPAGSPAPSAASKSRKKKNKKKGKR